MIIDIFLIPFYLFKYGFALIVWFFIISTILQTDWYWDLSQMISEKYKAIRNRKK